MPEERSELIQLFKTLIAGKPQDCVGYIEKVSAYIPDAGASMMLNYGIQIERPACILECLGVRMVDMPPKRWQNELGLERTKRLPIPKPPEFLDKRAKAQWNSNHKDEINAIKNQNSKLQREWKEFLKLEAERRFPTLAGITLKTCDALLILDAACKLEGQQLF